MGDREGEGFAGPGSFLPPHPERMAGAIRRKITIITGRIFLIKMLIRPGTPPALPAGMSRAVRRGRGFVRGFK
jgi:hypothetical protein